MLDVRDIPPEVAARAMAGLSRLDPRGLMTEADVSAMCHGGRCVAVQGDGGTAAAVLVESNGVLWVDAFKAEGVSAGLSEGLDEMLCKSGAKAIAFMTKRRGLVRRAERRGYRIAGYVMTKEI